MSQNIINNYRESENDKVMNQVIKDTEQQVYQMFDDAVQEEKRWSNISIFTRKYDWIVRKTVTPVCRTYGKPKNEGDTSNAEVRTKVKPTTLDNSLLSSRGLQNAPQETEIESYVIGGIKQDVKKRPIQAV